MGTSVVSKSPGCKARGAKHGCLAGRAIVGVSGAWKR